VTVHLDDATVANGCLAAGVCRLPGARAIRA
jgi:hypothetical protein